jgi:hypothetical protein
MGACVFSIESISAKREIPVQDYIHSISSMMAFIEPDRCSALAGRTASLFTFHSAAYASLIPSSRQTDAPAKERKYTTTKI